MKNFSDIESWFTDVKELTHLNVSRIPFSSSSEWEVKHGFITHRSGRFFQIAGLRYRREGYDVSQPVIIQQEVGILGFIICDYELLAYAKVEPGNVNAVQIAPTCQATASNLDRVHGGMHPFFGEWFTNKQTGYLYDSVQSEQGTRFFKKQNRNILFESQSQLPHNEMYKWLDVDMILNLMKYDFLVNTDARSTLVCSPWEKLVKRAPFTRSADSFSTELRASFLTHNRQSLSDLKNDIKVLRTQLPGPTLISINDLTDWNHGDHGVTSIDRKDFDIFQIKVHAEGREISDWDQPIISSNGEGYVELVCGRVDGLLHFLFVLQIEPGLYNKAELGPSLVIAPGSAMIETSYAVRSDASILLECRQSDEGGRFFQDITTYRLIDLMDAFPPPQNGFWLTLAEIRQLLNEDGWFTNEARSALSLLLAWL